MSTETQGARLLRRAAAVAKARRAAECCKARALGDRDMLFNDLAEAFKALADFIERSY